MPATSTRNVRPPQVDRVAPRLEAGLREGADGLHPQRPRRNTLTPAGSFADRRGQGGIDWARPSSLSHPLAAAHQAEADLPADQEAPGRPARTWP